MLVCFDSRVAASTLPLDLQRIRQLGFPSIILRGGLRDAKKSGSAQERRGPPARAQQRSSRPPAGIDGIEAFYELCVANGVTDHQADHGDRVGNEGLYFEDPMAASSASAAARPQANNRCDAVRVRNKLRRLSTLGYRKRFTPLSRMWIACGISALLATFERN